MNVLRWMISCGLLCACWGLPERLAAAEKTLSKTFVADGVKLHYLAAGKGPQVLLLHGLESSAEINWKWPGIIAGGTGWPLRPTGAATAVRGLAYGGATSSTSQRRVPGSGGFTEGPDEVRRDGAGGDEFGNGRARRAFPLILSSTTP